MNRKYERGSKPTVVVFTASCSKKGDSFGVRLEKVGPSHWIADWAFAIRPEVAKREGYDRTIIKGSFTIEDTYPGCPYCSNRSIVGCSCTTLWCVAEEASFFSCPSCKQTGEIAGPLNELSSGGDR